jgi:hypothetical protein
MIHTQKTYEDSLTDTGIVLVVAPLLTGCRILLSSAL